MNRLLVASVLAVVCGSSWVSAQALLGNPKKGEAIYQQHCLRCHGEKLDGNGPDGQYLIIKPADFQSLQSRSKGDWEMLVAITQGVLFSPMHGWRDRLTEEQVRDVLSYIRMMAPFSAVS